MLMSNRFKKEQCDLVDEIKILKQVIRNKNEEAVKKEQELSEVTKVLKSKKEEIQKLDHRQDTVLYCIVVFQVQTYNTMKYISKLDHPPLHIIIFYK